MEIKKLRILITGANGQLGYDFRRLLKEKGCEFVATDYRELDVTAEDMVRKFTQQEKFNLIINCAAYNDVDRAEDEKESCYRLNAYAPLYLAKAAKEIDAVFVTYSTDFVFDGEKGSPYTEEDKPNPLSVYGKSKLEGERFVLNEYDKSIVIRTSWLFGVGGQNFNTQVLRWARSNNQLKIVDDQISSPTYSYDLANFSLKLLKRGTFGLFHFSNRGIASKYDQALYVLKKAGWKGTLQRAKSSDFNLKARRPGFSKLDSSKMEALVKEKIPYWEDGIDRWWEEYNAI